MTCATFDAHENPDLGPGAAVSLTMLMLIALASLPPSTHSAAAPAAPGAPGAAPVAAPVEVVPAPGVTQRTKVLVVDVRSADLSEGERDALGAVITGRLARFSSLEVLSGADLRSMAALASDKASAGCEGDDGSCLAELAGALGAPWVLATQAGRLSGTTVVSFHLFDATASKTIARSTVQVSGLDDVTARVATAVDAVGREATQDEPGGVASSAPIGPAPSASANAKPPSGLKTGLLVGGGVGIGIGAVASAIGLVPSVLYGSHQRELVDLRRAWVQNQDAAVLADAAQVQTQAERNRAAWNTWGIGLFWGGLAIAAAGGGALAGGLVFEEGP